MFDACLMHFCSFLMIFGCDIAYVFSSFWPIFCLFFDYILLPNFLRFSDDFGMFFSKFIVFLRLAVILSFFVTHLLGLSIEE